ncbi:MAG: hypothetical protein ABI556_03490 [Gemmatimonadales bacterium]
MALLRSTFLLALVAGILTPSMAGAQNPWTVKVYSTMNPLPIGGCAAVRLEILDPVTRAKPRRPPGDYVTITDFDVTVTSPAGNSVAPSWITAYNLLACGCQTGSVGDNGVVTATYPARALPEYARVPGVVFQIKSDFSLSKPQNAVNPPSCSKPSVSPVVAVPPLPKPTSIATLSTTTPIAPTAVRTRTAIPVTSATPPPAPKASAPTNVTALPVGIIASPPRATSAPPPTIPPAVFYEWARQGLPASIDSLYGMSIEELRRALNTWIAEAGSTAPIPLTDVPSGRLPVSPPSTSTPAPTSAPMISPSTGVATSGTPTSGTALPVEPVSVRTTAGPTPTGLRFLPGVPLIASLAWDSMPNAKTYTLMRAVGTGEPVARVTLKATAQKAARDTVPDPRDSYLYTLVVTYGDGRWGTSPAVTFVSSQEFTNPTNFTVKHTGDGNVDFQWTLVDGAAQYRLDGPGFPDSGFVTPGPGTVSKIPAGANSWKLTALYQGNFADYSNPATASTVVRVLPPRTVAWLSKNNGVGSDSSLQMPKEMKGRINGTFTFGGMCQDSAYLPGRLETRRRGDIGLRTSWLGEQNFFCPNINLKTMGLQAWLNLPNMPLWADPSQYANEATYGNDLDLGVGRRTQCAQGAMTIPPYAVTTTCYATAHGIVPGEKGFNDINTITRPGEGTGDDFILAMVISKDASGSTFLVVLRDSLSNGGGPWYGHLADRVSLDTEGRKYVPQVCLSCHGGKFNTKTFKVDGASFLPLDPGLLAFSSSAAKAAQQEKMRKINAMIVTSAPQSAVASYIRGL